MNKINNKLIPLFIALQFLTRLPVSGILKKLSSGESDIYTEYNLARTLKYYPAIGLLIGSLLVLTSTLILPFASQHPLYVAAMVSVVWLLLTGGLHLDGVADMADAWVGGLGDKAKTLEIMKDPTCGPFGVISIVLVLLLKFVLVFELLRINPYLLFIAPFIARMSVIVLFVTTPCARDDGMAAMLSESKEKQNNIISVFLFSIILVYLLNSVIIPEIIIGIFVSGTLFYFLFRNNIMKRVSGITGDLAGAFIEAMELVVLFSLATLLMITSAF